MDKIIELNEKNIDFGKVYCAIKDAFYKPNYDKVINRVKEIFCHNSSIIFGYFIDIELVGCTVVGIINNKIVIEYIGVREESRQMNIARSLIEYVMNKYQLPCLAETDNSAVKFYKKCGFVFIEKIKEYSNEKILRYSCLKSIS